MEDTVHAPPHAGCPISATSEPFLVPQGARWDCRGCGKCCHHHVLGPVEPEVVQAIEAHGVEKLWPDRAGRPWAKHLPGPGPEGWYLEKIDGHCVFLDDDKMCTVHAQMGPAEKPAFCREYPFTVVREPRGLAIIVRESCGGFHEASVDGQPLEDHAAEVAALPRAYPVQEFGGQPVALQPGLGVTAEDWLYLEDAVKKDILDNDRQPAAHIAAVRARMLAAVRRDDPTPDRLKALRATGAMLQVYRMVLDKAVAEPSADAAEVAFAKKLRGHVFRAMSALPRGVPPLDRSARDYVSLLLRSHLLGKRFLPHGSVAAGLGLFLHNIHTAALAARVNAKGEVDVNALCAVLTDHVRLTLNRSIREVQKKARPALLDLYMSVG